jgi:hypothetical protein
MQARFMFWQATRDRDQLVAAHRRLVSLKYLAPEGCADSILEDLPLHKEIMKAWEGHGAS